MATSDLRQYGASARSTDTFGRVLCSVRQNHFVVDGPVWNEAPGEAATPGELFLAAVASCSVELLHVIARERDVGLRKVTTSIQGTIDRSRPVRTDVALFNSVRLDLELEGVSDRHAEELVEAFKGR
jgi:organic hydroperoxide reductase OsmC/OhrA